MSLPSITIRNDRKLIFYPEPNFEQNLFISEFTEVLIHSQPHWFLGVLITTNVFNEFYYLQMSTIYELFSTYLGSRESEELCCSLQVPIRYLIP